MNQTALALDPRPPLGLDHHQGDGQQDDAHILDQIIVVAGDDPGQGIYQEEGEGDRARASQGGEAHRLNPPALHHQSLAGQDGESSLRVRSAKEDRGNGIEERLGDAGGKDNRSHLKGGQSEEDELGGDGQEHGGEVVQVQARGQAAQNPQGKS